MATSIMKTTFLSLLIAFLFATIGQCLPAKDPNRGFSKGAGSYSFKSIKIESTEQPRESLLEDDRLMRKLEGTEEKYPSMKKWESHLANLCKKHSECKGWYASNSDSEDRLGYLFKGSAITKADFEDGSASDAAAYVKTKKKGN